MLKLNIQEYACLDIDFSMFETLSIKTTLWYGNTVQGKVYLGE